MSAVWAWIRRQLGFDVLDRVSALEKRVTHNEGAIDGAIQAFKAFAGEDKK